MFADGEWNSVRRMLNWPSRFIQHHVIFACKSTYTIRKDTRKSLKQLVSGDRESSPDIMCINSTFGRLWSIQLVVVLIRNNVHSKARLNDQNRPDSLAFNQIAVKQTSEISTSYTRRNFPEDRKSTTIRIIAVLIGVTLRKSKSLVAFLYRCKGTTLH